MLRQAISGWICRGFPSSIFLTCYVISQHIIKDFCTEPFNFWINFAATDYVLNMILVKYMQSSLMGIITCDTPELMYLASWLKQLERIGGSDIQFFTNIRCRACYLLTHILHHGARYTRACHVYSYQKARSCLPRWHSRESPYHYKIEATDILEISCTTAYLLNAAAPSI